MDTKVFSSKAKCAEKVKELIASKKAKGYSESSSKKRKRHADTSSDSDDDEEDAPPPKKRRVSPRKKAAAPNKTLLRKLLKASSVLLQHEEEDQTFEAMVENKSFTSVKAQPMGSKGRQITKKFASRSKATQVRCMGAGCL